MPHLNYHHLRLFRAIAQHGSLTAAAAQLNIAPSALSVQLRALEAQLGHALFDRTGRRLELTEAGRITLSAAEGIFTAGDELLATLAGGGAVRRTLRVGALPTLSRNFQLQFLTPLLNRPDVSLVVHSGSLGELLTQLEAHTLDVVLGNVAVQRDAATRLHSHLLAEQAVSLVGKPAAAPFNFPDDLRHTPVLLPGLGSDIRAGFDRMMDLANIRPVIAAELDDMTMLRLLARESDAVALVPPVVVRDELAAGTLVERCMVPQLRERFFAITGARRFPHPLLKELLPQD